MRKFKKHFNLFTIIIFSIVTFMAVALLYSETKNQNNQIKNITSSKIKGINMETNPDKLEIATLGGGCFWCMEAVFERVEGVIDVVSGYSGGTVENPTYEQVCSGNTGHAEVVQITFNPKIITYSKLLDIFWKAHDPTTIDRQGADVGSQYRSIILYHNKKQKRIAEESLKKLEESGYYSNPIVTEIVPFKAFYPAEDYHQDYYAKNPHAPYCIIVIKPKLEKLKKLELDQTTQ